MHFKEMVIGLIFAIGLIVWIISGGYQSFIDSITNPQTSTSQQVSENILSLCKGNADCFAGKITRVHDGDTVYVDGKSIRLALTSTPELNEEGGLEARGFTLEVCPIGSNVIVDEDDGQTEGSFDRTLAVVYCDGLNLNEEILEAEWGWIDTSFCSKSEFGEEGWAKRFGC